MFVPFAIIFLVIDIAIWAVWRDNMVRRLVSHDEMTHLTLALILSNALCILVSSRVTPMLWVCASSFFMTRSEHTYDWMWEMSGKIDFAAGAIDIMAMMCTMMRAVTMTGNHGSLSMIITVMNIFSFGIQFFHLISITMPKYHYKERQQPHTD